MIAQSKNNPNLKVEVISYGDVSFKGRILKDSQGWKAGEVCNSFSIQEFVIVQKMRDFLDRRTQLIDLIKG